MNYTRPRLRGWDTTALFRYFSAHGFHHVPRTIDKTVSLLHRLVVLLRVPAFASASRCFRKADGLMNFGRDAMRREIQAVWLLFVLGTACAGEDLAPLPEPLSLGAALELAARSSHPELAEARARQRRAESRLEQAEADDDWRLDVEARLRLIDPDARALDQSVNDSRLGIALDKRLYDFGYTEAAIDSARHAVEEQRLALFDARRRRLLVTLRAFFDVLLADLAYSRDNEAMSVQFVRLDKKRNAHELGQVSDLALARAEDDYQRARVARAASELKQRLARQRLANALNRPRGLPSELEEPELGIAALPAPDFDPAIERALRHNPRLRALRERVSAATAALAQARRAEGPVLRARLGARAWQRESTSHHPLRAELRLDVPLYTGGRRAAAVAEARAGLDLARARLASYRLSLRERVLDRVLAISRLKVALERQQVLADRRDLELDRSRALYEMEVNTDLGDAMTQISAARLARRREQYELALAWVELKLLMGDELNEQKLRALLAGDGGESAGRSAAAR